MPTANGNSNQPQTVHMDSVEAVGSYSPAQIAIQSAQFVRGESRIVLNGTLDASDGSEQSFDKNSVVHAQIAGTNVDIADIQPFFSTGSGQRFPITGDLNTRIQVDGPLHAPSGSGSVEINGGSLYGEAVDHLQIQGAIANEELKVTSATLKGAGGNIAASGSYDFRAKAFKSTRTVQASTSRRFAGCSSTIWMQPAS